MSSRSKDASAPAHALATGLRSLVTLLQETDKTDVLNAALTKVNVASESLRGGSATMTVAQMVALQEVVADLTGRGDLGLRLAERFHPGDWGALGYMLLNCATIEQMLQQLSTYVVVFQEDAGVRFERDAEGISLSYGIEASQVGRRRQDAEASLAMAVRLVRVASGRRVVPSEVWFEHEAPAEIAQHRRFFGIPVYFGRGRNMLFLDAEVAALPVQGADPRLHAVLQRYIDDELVEASHDRDLRKAVSNVLRGMLPNVGPTLGAVATRVGLTERALQRRLARYGTSFKRELAATRIEIALGLLRGTGLEMKEIAFAAGFSTLPAFSNAFRVATGLCPSRWRADVRSSVESRPPPPSKGRTPRRASPPS